MAKRFSSSPGRGWLLSEAEVVERINYLRKLYTAEDHPILAWRAYDLARSAHLAIPDWVLEYFDLATHNLERIAGPTPGKGKRQIAPAIARAFGFRAGGVELTFSRQNWPQAMDAYPLDDGKPGAFNPLKVPDTDLFYSEGVTVCMKLGQTLTQAKKSVARAHHVNVKTIVPAAIVPVPGAEERAERSRVPADPPKA